MLNLLMPATTIRVTSSSGTDLEISLDSGVYRWISNRGMQRAGSFVILPSGEVSTFPANINGVLVADGAFNVSSLTQLDARLADHPVRIEISEGHMVDYSCEHPLVMKLIRRCLDYENFRRVGELGFGTNVGIEQFVSLNSHINERHPGVHVGLGGHGQLLDVVPYLCDLHFDLIASDARIAIAGGNTIESYELATMTGDHPAIQRGLHDEDLDGLEGDCCGLSIC
jgi:leucyl aminopeptidase (aminopeptidase T)